MMAQEQGASPKNRDWETESLRITNFLVSDAQVDEVQSWWEKIVGREPEEILSRPGSGQVQQIGDFEGQKLVLAVGRGRVNLQMVRQLTPQIPQDELGERIPTMGPFDKLIESFKELGRKWLDICPSTNRLAVGGILLMPVPSVAAGHSKISSLISHYTIPENSSDFLFQINQPRMSTSGMSNVKINRLTKLSVMASGVIELKFGSGNPMAIVGDHPQQLAVRLELDINTPADSTDAIPRDKITKVFEELVDFGSEISKEGIIP